MDWKDNVLKFSFKKWLSEYWPLIIFLVLLTLTIFFNGLTNEFLSDDIATIVNNPEIKSFKNISRNFPGVIGPVIHLIISSLFGINPLFFRLVNVLFHLGNVLLLFLLLYLLFQKMNVALLGSVLFAVHPLTVESVTWISGGPYPQYSFFIMSSLVFFILCYKDQKYKWFCYGSIILALLSSEKAMVAPFLLFIFILSFSSIKKEWKKLIVPFILGGAWILLSLIQTPKRISTLQTDYYQEGQMLNPLIQLPVSISSYFQLAFWPDKLTLYHSEMVFGTINFIIRTMVLLAYLILLVVSFKKWKALFFWLAFIIISLAPMLTPFGISWVVAERYVYLGLMGILSSFSLVINKLSEKNFFRIPIILLLIVMIIGFSARTIRRNIDWKNQDNLWLAAAKTSPSSAQNHNNLGDLYGRHGNFEKAAEEFLAAISLKPNYADAYHNLGNTYWQMGKVDLAIQNYQNALKYNPRLWQSHQNLGLIYLKNEELNISEQHFLKAIQINPQQPSLHHNLALVFIEMERLEEAKKELQIALQLSPENTVTKQLLYQLVLPQN